MLPYMWSIQPTYLPINGYGWSWYDGDTLINKINVSGTGWLVLASPTSRSTNRRTHWPWSSSCRRSCSWWQAFCSRRCCCCWSTCTFATCARTCPNRRMCAVAAHSSLSPWVSATDLDNSSVCFTLRTLILSSVFRIRFFDFILVLVVVVIFVVYTRSLAVSVI